MNHALIRFFAAGLMALCAVAGAKAQYVNFAEALQKSLYFYDAQKSGPGITGGRLEWRGDSEVADARIPLNTEMTNLSTSFINQYNHILDPDGDGTVDVSGGFHDAGDHVKFGLPQSYSASTLGWGYYEFRAAFEQSGQAAHMEEVLRWFADYFLRSTFTNVEGDVVAFCYQVGEGNIDHNYWGPPELQRPEDYPRPAYFATAETPASDQAAGAAAALALMNLNFKSTDPTYAQQCLQTAIALYDFAKANRGLGYDGGFYDSSFDEDELSWAAIWLHIATQQPQYLEEIIRVDANGRYTGWLKKIIATTADTWQNIWVHSWDTVWGGVFAKLAAITDDPFHWYIFRWNLEYWSGVPHEDPTDNNYLTKTPAGYSFLTIWGSARYNTTAQLQALVYRKYTGDTRFADWARGQMEYLMGNNPLSKSYIVGYSDNHVLYPHHRAAHGTNSGSALVPLEHKHTLWGALVGGPGREDEHIDSTDDYIYNEVACDYNAGFVGALAGHYAYYADGDEPLANFPPAEPKIDPFFAEARLELEDESRTQLTIKINNIAIHPPRFESTLKARYFFNISELVAVGQTIDDVSFQVYYDEQKAVYGSGVKAVGPIPWDVANGVYYFEMDWSGFEIYGSREYQFGILARQGPGFVGYWDPTNDFSRQGITGQTQLNQNIPIYVDGKLAYGQEPPQGSGAPFASLVADKLSGVAPLTVNFDATASFDPDGTDLSFVWNFGEGATSNDAIVAHTFTQPGDYEVTLTVVDADGESSQKTVNIRAVEGGGGSGCNFGAPLSNPLPTINNVTYDYVHPIGDQAPDLSNLTSMTLNWNLESNAIWQFSMQTNDGQPDWYIDLRGFANTSWNTANPNVTFQGTGIAGFDGSYDVAVHEGNFVMASQTDGFTLYFSNSATPPSCGNNAKLLNTTRVAAEQGLSIHPNPSAERFRLSFQGAEVASVKVMDMTGEMILAITPENKADMVFGERLPAGAYIVIVQHNQGTAYAKIIKQ